MAKARKTSKVNSKNTADENNQKTSFSQIKASGMGKQNNNDKKPVKLPDPVATSLALLEAYQKAVPLYEDFIKQHTKSCDAGQVNMADVSRSYVDFMQNIIANPHKYWNLQMHFWQDWMELWQHSTLKFLGESPVFSKDLHAKTKPEMGDRRFKASQWQDSAVFDFIKQSYLLTCDWTQKCIDQADELTQEEKNKLNFYSQLYANALSPSNFILTNPEVLEETINTGGENLVRGLQNLIEDLKRGQGELKISTTDYNAFELGENIASTKGKVIYQNELMQLIQYEASTDEVCKTPLLIVPPWINKYYILDLKEDNSLIKWAVDQGYTVFVISWVNPDSKLAQKRFEEYMDEGVLESLDHIEKITQEKQCNVLGYCLGGTLLTITLAYLAAQKQEERIASATFLTTLVDFEHAGDMKIFMDDAQLDLLDKQMAQKGILEGKHLQKTFSLLRANDLIWSFVVNNYLMGKEPFPFDLLYWNDDSTNMPAAMHSFYIRKLYRDNLLMQPGGIKMHDTEIDITRITTPSYFLSTKEDHIAPWKATYRTTQLFSGPKQFTLAASGHIAGVINSPIKNKYCYWVSKEIPESNEKWLASAEEKPGSWWTHWGEWIKSYSGSKIKSSKRRITSSLEQAPGSYVKAKNA